MESVFKSKNFEIFSFDETECKNLVAVSQKTPWCTKEEYTAKRYLQDYHIFLIKKKGKEHSLFAILKNNIELPDGDEDDLEDDWNEIDEYLPIQWQAKDDSIPSMKKSFKETREEGIVDFVIKKYKSIRTENSWEKMCKKEIISMTRHMINSVSLEDTNSLYYGHTPIALHSLRDFANKDTHSELAANIIFDEGQNDDLEERLSKVNAELILLYVKYSSKKRLKNKNCERQIFEHRKKEKYLHLLNSIGQLKPRDKKAIENASVKAIGH